RAVALYALKQGFIGEDFFDVEKLVANLDNIEIYFKYNPETGISETYLNGENVEKEIRSFEVSGYVSKVAEISEVRAKLVKEQQKMGNNKSIVMDGRDIGTVVFPDAELKLFITSKPQIRAQRRFEELTNKGEQVTFE